MNPRTLRTRFLGIRRATAHGWQRLWLPRDETAEMALLSVAPVEGENVGGVVVYDRSEHLPSVDEREAGYARRIVHTERLDIEKAPVTDVPFYIYEAHRGVAEAPEMGSAILQSYLDAVMQGFRMLYGGEGLKRFVDGTQGFETRVLKDRHAPRYPRAVKLEEGEAELFDRLVSERGAVHVESA